MVPLLSYHFEKVPIYSLRIVCNEMPPCPKCGKKLKYRDSVRRKCLNRAGNACRIQIPRGKCGDCRSIHRMEPPSLCPYKHYKTSVIKLVLTDYFKLAENGPSEWTINRWGVWADNGYVSQSGKSAYDWFSR